MLAADNAGIKSFGFESQPLVSRIAQTKLEWDVDIVDFNQMVQEALNIAEADRSDPYEYPPLVHKCYDETNLLELGRLRKAIEAVCDDSKAWHMAWLAFVCIIRPTSHAGTAIGQYVLPSHGKARVATVRDVCFNQAQEMVDDLMKMQSHGVSPKAELIEHDARNVYHDLLNSIDLVVTSPPYANNYDYADATRLELSVLGEITGWSDLQKLIRPGLIRSCTQMVSKERKGTYVYVDDPVLAPIHEELSATCHKMEHDGRITVARRITTQWLRCIFMSWLMSSLPCAMLAKMAQRCALSLEILYHMGCTCRLTNGLRSLHYPLGLYRGILIQRQKKNAAVYTDDADEYANSIKIIG